MPLKASGSGIIMPHRVQGGPNKTGPAYNFCL